MQSDSNDQELDPERLAELLGREMTRDPDHPLWCDERFLTWLGAEAREEVERAHRLSDREFRRRGEEFIARAQARRLAVAREAALVAVKREETDPVRPRAVREGPVPIVELGIAAGLGRELWDEPVSSWVEMPPNMPVGEYVALRIIGESMAPLMHTGDTVLVRIGTDVRRDTIIVARHPDDGYVCKRVSRIRRECIELSSLERGRSPIVIPRDPSNIVGTVILVWCHHRH